MVTPLVPPNLDQRLRHRHPVVVGNAIEDAAITFVIEQEKREGRQAHDTRYKGAAADVESDGRIIEVKAAGTSTRGYDVWLGKRQYEAAKDNPDHFWLYLVENIGQGDPTKFRLIRIGGEPLQQLIAKAKRREHWEMPLPVAVYDELAEG